MPNADWVQYGCFGLLSALVVWTVWRGIPTALEIHRRMMVDVATAHQLTVGRLIETFEQHTAECRSDRIERDKAFHAQVEADRKLRHDERNQMQRWMESIDVLRTDENG